MKFTTTNDQPSLTVYLPEREMHVTVRNDGSVTVTQKTRETSTDLYTPGGEYELALPDVITVSEECSARDDSDLDSGTASVEVTHRH